MAVYKMVVAYDGTAYAGWQIQPDAVAIANVLQTTFFHVFHKSIKIIGASRTDAGVHALGQVASFVTDLSLDAKSMKKAWNNSLPGDILIRSLEKAADTFHPQCMVRQKIYWYHFFVERPLPFVQRYGHYVYKKVDITALQKSLALFVGT